MLCDFCGKSFDCSGIEINQTHICSSCELELISIEASDPDYPLWIERIKKVWESIRL
ncbi:MAG: hypothetical protein GX177_01855 [Firmicutes bacterium]|nr:hypothetical protein [Bacillota bacterium]